LVIQRAGSSPAPGTPVIPVFPPGNLLIWMYYVIFGVSAGGNWVKLRGICGKQKKENPIYIIVLFVLLF